MLCHYQNLFFLDLQQGLIGKFTGMKEGLKVVHQAPHFLIAINALLANYQEVLEHVGQEAIAMEN